MNLWSHRSYQNTDKKLSRFLPSLLRAEILTIFRSYFGRNNDLINSFWNCLTFSKSSKFKGETQHYVEKLLKSAGATNFWFQRNKWVRFAKPLYYSRIALYIKPMVLNGELKFAFLLNIINHYSSHVHWWGNKGHEHLGALPWVVYFM